MKWLLVSHYYTIDERLTHSSSDTSHRRWEWMQRATTGKCADSETLWSTQFWVACLPQGHLSKLMGLCSRGGGKFKSQRWWMSPRKQCLPDPTELMHICTHRDWAKAHKTCTGPCQKGSQDWEENVDSRTNQTKKLLVIGICWQKENQFSPMDCYWAYQAYSRAYCEVRSWPTQNELYGVFLLGNVSFCFGIFGLLFSSLMLMFVFLWFKRETHRDMDIHTKKEGKTKRERERQIPPTQHSLDACGSWSRVEAS